MGDSEDSKTLEDLKDPQCQPPPLSEVSYLFRCLDQNESRSILYLIGGCALLAVAMVGIGILFFVDVHVFALQGMITLPILMSIGCFSAAWFGSKSPRSVALRQDQLEVQTRSGVTHFKYNQLSMCTMTMSVIGRRRLRVFDKEGKKILEIPDSLERFDEFVDILRARIESFASPQNEAVRSKKSRRQAYLVFGLGIFFLALIVTLFIIERVEANNARLLDTQGVEIDAKITRHYLAPDGRTQRIEYQIAAPNVPPFTNDCQLRSDLWNALGENQTIPAIYVPSKPGISRLKIGEVKDSFEPGPAGKLLIYIGGTLMSLFFIAAAILNFKGYDLDLDSKTGKISIKRFGSGS